MLEPSVLTFGDWISVTEAAKRYGKNRATIYRQIGLKTSSGRIGRIRSRQTGNGMIQIYAPSLDSFADRVGWIRVGDEE